MTDLFLLSEAQMRRIERYFPLSHGVARVDDRRIVSAIVFVISMLPSADRWGCSITRLEGFNSSPGTTAAGAAASS